MPRPKGSKNKPKVISDEKAAAILEKREEKIHNSPTLTPMAKNDKEYLQEMLAAFVVAVAPEVSSDEVEHTTRKFRYTPKMMFDNICKYFTMTIERGQPLTITGMAMFCGLSRDYMFSLTAGKPIGTQEQVPKEYAFLLECRRFVESYNEFAIHKKQNPAGPIFVLKNFGWKDKLEIEATANTGALSEEERKIAQKRIESFSEVK